MHYMLLLARLNPKNVRFDVGSGGVPELTSTDVAGALGMVSPGLGRELMCRVGWQAGASVTARQLDEMLMSAQLDEWLAREEALAQATWSIASHAGGQSLRRAQQQYQDAHARRWPKWLQSVETGVHNPGYPRIRRAVLLELADPKLCPDCGGRCHVPTETGLKECERCQGRGCVEHGPTRRAQEMRMHEATYRQTWADPYEWLMDLATTELRRAAKHLERAAA